MTSTPSRPQGRLGRVPRALRPRADQDLLVVRVPHRAPAVADDPPRGRQLDVVAAAGDRAPHESFVLAVAVRVGGVEQGGAGVDRVAQHALARVPVGVAVHAVDQRHRAVSDVGARPQTTSRSCGPAELRMGSHPPDWWAVNPRPDGSEPRWGPENDNVEEMLEQVADGSAYAIVPASMTEYYARPDLVWIPITDIDPLRIALAWRERDGSPLVAAFAAVVRELIGS
jgi:DNA-binding transcriptional LysR family regulator